MLIQPEKPTPRQIEVLRGILDPILWPRIATMTKYHASNLIWEHSQRCRDQPATPKQKGLLISRNLWRDGMTKGESCDLIGQTLDKEARMTEEEKVAYRHALKEKRRHASVEIRQVHQMNGIGETEMIAVRFRVQPLPQAFATPPTTLRGQHGCAPG